MYILSQIIAAEYFAIPNSNEEQIFTEISKWSRVSRNVNATKLWMTV